MGVPGLVLAAGGSRRLGEAGVADAELQVEVGGPVREDLDQAGGGVLGEEAGRAHPQQPAALTGSAHLQHRDVLQPEHLGRPAGQPQPARRERQATPAAGEQLVAQLLAELSDVQRHG